MAAWRIWGSVVVVIALARTAPAQNYPLVENSQAGDCFHINITMQLSGDMRVIKDKQPASLKLAASASHEFSERTLAVDKGIVQKMARLYQTAKAAISVQDDRSERTLRSDRQLIVAQRYKGLSLVYSPSGPLTAQELELTAGHFDTLALPGLLPGKSVATGETWKIDNDAVQAICLFEGLTAQDLTAKLDEVKANRARVSLSGTASGIELGALVKLTIEATYEYDLNSQRLVALKWKQKDERGQGPASPATTVTSTTSLSRAAITQPDNLTDVALVAVPDGFEPPAAMTQVYYQHGTKTTLDLMYGRDWQMVGQTADHVVLRLLDRGDFVAQATITPWESAKPGEHLAVEAFRDAMAKTPGWEQGEILQEGESKEGSRWIYRMAAEGRMDGLKVVQNFYLVAGPGGDQVVVAFTMTPTQVEKLGNRDVVFIEGIDFPTKKSGK